MTNLSWRIEWTLRQHPELRAVKEVEEQRNLNAIKMQAWSLRDKQEVLI